MYSEGTAISRQLEFPRPRRADKAYWLCRCVGFRDETSQERLGVIGDVRYRTRLDRPDELVVRGGLLGTRAAVVPISDVTSVAPRRAGSSSHTRLRSSHSSRFGRA